MFFLKTGIEPLNNISFLINKSFCNLLFFPKNDFFKISSVKCLCVLLKDLSNIFIFVVNTLFPKLQFESKLKVIKGINRFINNINTLYFSLSFNLEKSNLINSS